ncbi:hypothetical protein WJX73_009229 [Symbiochloris irregularis]|uniref:BZIP domain-containing protein n=1 Tax=Symbiochloris irregularis TaxID=706552 RepID=A0AAW1P6B9_9CHLO
MSKSGTEEGAQQHSSPETDQAAPAFNKKARQLELRRSRNRRAQSRFRSKAKAQHEEWNSELELLRQQVQHLQEEKRIWLAEKDRLVSGLQQVRQPSHGPVDVACLSPLTKVQGQTGVLDYTAMPSCIEALMHMYGRLEAFPILDLKRVQADELVIVRKDLIGMLRQMLGNPSRTSELNALVSKWVAQVRIFYRSSGHSMGSIYWSQHHVESRSSELRRWSDSVAAMGLSIRQQEQIREAAVRRHLWISYLVNEQRTTGHDFQGLDQDFMDQVYTYGTFSKAVTMMGHLQGVLDAMLNIQVEFLVEVCEIMTLPQVALGAIHSFETIGTAMFHVPGIGILDGVLAQSRVCEELDSVDAFLNQV